MKKPEINYGEIQKATEDAERRAFDYFLDIDTGDVVILSEEIIERAQELLAERLDDDTENYDAVEFDEDIDVPPWMEDEIELALDIFLYQRDRYVRIPERDPVSCHEAMKSFAQQVQNGPLRSQLLSVLDGKGAFRRFKDALGPHPKERKQWYSHNARFAREEIKRWLLMVFGEDASS